MTEERLEEMRKECEANKRVESESTYQYEARVIAKYYWLSMRAVYIKTGSVEGWDDKMLHDHFIVCLTREFYSETEQRMQYRTMEIRFHGSANDAVKHPKRLPRTYDILSCLQKSDPGTLEDFCGEFGYDTDSKRADATYQAIKKEYEDFAALFPEGIPEEILDIA